MPKDNHKKIEEDIKIPTDGSSGVESDTDSEVVTDDSLDDSVIGEEHAVETIKKLREKLKKCEAEKQEYLTGWQRMRADVINARKRDEEERKTFMMFANERLIEGLLPVLESFHMAMANKEAWEKVEKNWRLGVEYIYSQLMTVLTDSGVTEINPTNGVKFDHSVHEAAEYVPVPDEKLDHYVIDVVQKGYSLNGKILKPAKVKVGEYKK